MQILVYSTHKAILIIPLLGGISFDLLYYTQEHKCFYTGMT